VHLRGAFCRHIAKASSPTFDRELQDVKAALIDARLELEEAEGDRADLKLEELGMDKDDG
jgi:hypothetical protein